MQATRTLKYILKLIVALGWPLLILLETVCYAQVTADFAATPYNVPANVLGINMNVDPSGNNTDPCPGTSGTNNIDPCLVGAKITRGRMFVSMDQIFTTAGMTWSSLDSSLTVFKNIPLHPILVLVNTPASLQKQFTNPPKVCAPVHHAPPTSYSMWGQDAALVVAHVDAAFPGLVTDYEIWNEPDLNDNALCSQSGTDAERLQEYLSIYEGAAPAMKSQAAADGVSINIGGPVLAVPAHLDEWLRLGTPPTAYGLLNDPNLKVGSTYPYVNFVSYHHYLTGDTWSGTACSDGIGISCLVTATFNQMPKYVKDASDQIQMEQLLLPIYITETNDSAGFDPTSTDCCRDKAPYAGAWMVLSVIQQFSGIYSDANAKAPYLYYFRAEPLLSNGQVTGFCMFALLDSAMDCQRPTAQQLYSPYPQYFAFKFFKLAHLQDGGQLTGVQALGPSGTAVLSYKTQGTSPFWVTVVSNPTATVYPSTESWTFNNVSGVTSATAYWLTCTQNNCVVNANSTTLTINGSTATANFKIPAYSAVAVALK